MLVTLPKTVYGAACAVGDHVFYVGGGVVQQWFDTVYQYSIQQDAWKQVSNMNFARGSLRLVQVRGKLYALGGGKKDENSKMTHHDTVEVYDMQQNVWQLIQNKMLNKRFMLGAVVIENAIYAVGGYDGKQYLNSVERFDPREGIWEHCMDMSICRGGHGAVNYNNDIVVCGGFNGSQTMDLVEALDIRTNQSRSLPSLQERRVYGVFEAMGNCIYGLGGLYQNEVLHSMEILDMNEAQQWQKQSIGEEPQAYIQSFQGSCVVNTYE
eukprot:TRINITY_DN13989_c0_g1_i2.p1 TRINITY_DN13989_c0_g1~~TRINITY_DN13989_c0_g1_i2.p1  ORF type:complete len:267 (-),score=42.15 TRINITY_DN13989_c0_g1_i2:122-922(-)